MMPWVITAIVSWVILYFLVDVTHLKKTIFGGIFTVTIGSVVDWGGQRLDLYKFHDVIIPWAGCSIFYKFGPILVMGILFTQYLPQKRYLQIINIIVMSLLYLSIEAIILQTPAAEYINWHILASFTIDLAAFTSLTWFAQTFQLAPSYQHRYFY